MIQNNKKNIFFKAGCRVHIDFCSWLNAYVCAILEPPLHLQYKFLYTFSIVLSYIVTATHVKYIILLHILIWLTTYIRAYSLFAKLCYTNFSLFVFFFFTFYFPGVAQRFSARHCVHKVSRPVGHMLSVSRGRTTNTNQTAELSAICQKPDGKSTGEFLFFGINLFYFPTNK